MMSSFPTKLISSRGKFASYPKLKVSWAGRNVHNRAVTKGDSFMTKKPPRHRPGRRDDSQSAGLEVKVRVTAWTRLIPSRLAGVKKSDNGRFSEKLLTS